MHLIGDFHIHGRYAQACSKTTTLEDLERNARIKGLQVLGTGDCQHPLWHKEITSKLTEDEHGILWSKTKFPFLWQTEISLAYTQGGKGRRIHHVVLLPNGDVVKQFIDALLKKGRIDYDGRPIFGMSSIEFVDMLRSISQDIEVIPAHCWTSWFAIFGSKSGFDSVEECFEDRAKHIHALETGMSCYDIETEVLTNNGWKRFPDIKYNDQICTLNQTTHNIELQKPTNIMSYTYKGKMYKLKTKRIDLFVTPNHKLFYSHCDFRKKTEFLLNEAEFAFNKAKRFKKDGFWKGKSIEYFTLPAVKIKHGSRYYSGFRDKKEKKLPIQDWLKFFGFWIAEGWVTDEKDGAYSIYLSNTNYKLIKEMKEILHNLGYDAYYDSKENYLRFRDFQLYTYLKPFDKCWKKYVPNEVKSLSKDLLDIFLTYYIKGDGHIYGRTGKGLSASTTSVHLRDDLQEIALKVGMSAYYKLHQKKGTPIKNLTKNKIYYQRNDSWNIYFIRRNIHTVLPSTIKKNKKYTESWIDFEDKVFCVEVPNHVIYIRRNGIPVWCGNSDPAMNWRLSKLDKYNLVSFSDPHSAHPWRLGREATMFDLQALTYKNILHAIRTGQGLKGTIETPPEYGKYHFDGHRSCNVQRTPEETRKLGKQCPKCNQEMTIGVEYRIEELADRPADYVKPGAPPFHSLIPLHELLGAVHGIKLMTSKKLTLLYQQLIAKFGTEYNVLLEAPEPDLLSLVGLQLTKVILKNRHHQLKVQAGYDGVYGTLLLEKDEQMPKKQRSLTEF